VRPSLRYGCYRGSRIATLPLALSVSIARAATIWERHLDAIIALTEFQRDLLAHAGIPRERLFVKANFYPGAPEVRAWSHRRPAVVFVGRLSEEKGVLDLIEAWAAWGEGAPELRVIGDGPLRKVVEARAGRSRAVRLLGQLAPSAARDEIAAARLIVVPSVCLEAFPLVIREAFAFGTAVAVSDIGSLPEIVRHGKAGILFTPRNPGSLLEAVRGALSTPGELERLGAAGRAEFERKYGEDANYTALMHIYEEAIERRGARSRIAAVTQ
jgi:glycosyltransferase involved in cell wall biosynthesis